MVPVTRAGEIANAVIDNARAALAGAKRRGGNQLRVFDPDEDELPVSAKPKDTARRSADSEVDSFLEETFGGAVQVDPQSGSTGDSSPSDDDAQQEPDKGDGLAELMDEGRLVLQRQVVSPIGQQGELKPHYEIVVGSARCRGKY